MVKSYENTISKVSVAVYWWVTVPKMCIETIGGGGARYRSRKEKEGRLVRDIHFFIYFITFLFTPYPLLFPLGVLNPQTNEE